MTRKHFRKLAEAISEVVSLVERAKVARLVADVCKDVNPLFDREKFYHACGLK